MACSENGGISYRSVFPSIQLKMVIIMSSVICRGKVIVTLLEKSAVMCSQFPANILAASMEFFEVKLSTLH